MSSSVNWPQNQMTLKKPPEINMQCSKIITSIITKGIQCDTFIFRFSDILLYSASVIATEGFVAFNLYPQYVGSVESCIFLKESTVLQVSVHNMALQVITHTGALYILTCSIQPPRYALMPRMHFYEFIPVEACDEEQPGTLLMNQVSLRDRSTALCCFTPFSFLD